MGQPTPPVPPTPTPPDPGATPPATPPVPNPPADPANPPATDGDKPLGEAGQKALAAERAARKELEKRLDALAPLTKLADALGVKAEGGKTDVDTLREQVEQMRQAQTAAEVRALRLEVAAEKGLTPAQAARLVGATRDELAADAEALKGLFPAAAGTATPGTPAPDLSQGARGGANELTALLKVAQEKKDVREIIRLKQAIAAQKTPR